MSPPDQFPANADHSQNKDTRKIDKTYSITEDRVSSVLTNDSRCEVQGMKL